MKIRFKITSALFTTIRIDLRRPHSFAHERVGFIAAGLAAARDELLILAREYRPVDEELRHLAGLLRRHRCARAQPR